MNRLAETKEEFGCVVLLDALGTKGIWRRQNPNEIIENWNAVIDSQTRVIIEDDENKKVITKILAFSDTLIMTKTSDSVEDLFYSVTLDLVTMIPLAMCENIFFRGCISIGKFYSSDKIIIGPAIDEAAQYYELPQWVGVSATPSFFNIIEENPSFQNSTRVTKWDIPLKHTTEKNGWAINWVEFTKLPIMQDNLKRKKLKCFEDIFINQMKKTTDLSASLKIRNTLDFFKNN